MTAVRGMALALLVVFLCGLRAGGQVPPPFSTGALQYLLDRNDYERFDWYVTRYISYHPDSVVLRVLQGYRYFREAEQTARIVNGTRNDRTGGIPRRYPEHIVRCRPRQLAFSYVKYDQYLLGLAFDAMYEALTLEPGRRDVWVTMCRMAAQAGRPDMLMKHLGWGMERFGIDSVAVQQVVDVSLTERDGSQDSTVADLLRLMANYAPSPVVYAELARFYNQVGDRGHATAYLREAASGDSLSPAVLRAALDMAASHGDFALAHQLAARLAQMSGTDEDRSIAAVFAFADTVSAGELRRARTESKRNASALAGPAFQARLLSYLNDRPELFEDDRFCLNFAVLALARRLGDDDERHYVHKAGLFYVCAMYDSAAYYNLQLLRWHQRNSELKYATAFNLAAEYYAAGQYLLSYLRFLDLYKYADGNRDSGVRYGLGMNCQAYGDRGQAVWHFQEVATRGRTKYDRYYPLRSLARQHLAQLRGVEPRAELSLVLQ